jgi:leucyl-tRNA synthetase
VLQVNGKVRGAEGREGCDARRDRSRGAGRRAFAKFSEGKPAKKIVVVPGRLVNIVV